MHSTPQRSRLKRLSVLNNSVSLPSPRKSILAINSPTPGIEPANDEVERSKRRSVVTLQKRLTNISSSSAVESGSILEESQVKDHFRICLKLFAENKISLKNAWQLHVIDVMKPIMKKNETKDLQVAAPGLDVGSKVYGLRVDDVHHKGFQLSLLKSKEGKENIDPNEDENVESLNNENAPKKKKIKKMGAKDKRNILDKDGKHLFSSHKHVDSAIFATKENIDVDATDNLFTNKLHTNPRNHQLMLLNPDKYWGHTEDKVLELTSDLPEIEILPVENYHLCLPFKDFDMANWNLEEEEKLLSEESRIPDVVLDDDGLPIAELDGSVHDIFENPVIEDHSDVEEQEVFQAQLHGGIANIVDVVPEESRIETEFGFNALTRPSAGAFFEKIWAGPSHWKVKYNRRSMAKYSGSAIQVVKQGRKIKEFEKFDFFKEYKNPIEDIGEVKTKRARAKVQSAKITLPLPDLGLCLYSFRYRNEHLLLKPNVRRPLLKNATQNKDYEVKDYNYENLNDSEYLSQNSFVDNNEPDQHSFEEELPPAAQQQFLDDNLVDAPEMVTQTQMAYAMRAKKMDMKKLKISIWKCLAPDSADSNNSTKIKQTQFTDMYRTLPNLLNIDMKKDLSCPLAFVALLHLCNENNLELIRNPNANDFTIVSSVK